MGFGGSAAAMITSLKNNARRRKTREHFSRDKLGFGKKGALDEFDFPKATPEQLLAIKEKMRKENRKRLIMMISTFILVAIAITSGLLYLFN